MMTDKYELLDRLENCLLPFPGCFFQEKTYLCGGPHLRSAQVCVRHVQEHLHARGARVRGVHPGHRAKRAQR